MNKEYMEELVSGITFEHTIFSKVAGSDSYSIVSTPVNGKEIEEEVLAQFIAKCRKKGIVPIIEFFDKDYVVISSPDTTNTAILSKSSLHGFEC